MKKTLTAIVLTLLILCTPVVALAAGTYNEYPEVYLSTETTQYELNSEYDYTVFGFEPSEEAEYTIATDSLIGIVSYNGMWITIEPDESTVTESSIVWECTGVGQSIWVAVKGGADTAEITITSKQLINDEMPWTVYENKYDVVKFTYDGNFDDLTYVETFDDVANTAVEGDDGFYHLDSANGPILYVNFTESLMSLLDKDGFAIPLKAALYENDELVEKIEFNTAFEAYRANAHTKGDFMLYPLTEDIIKIYTVMGDANSWYGEGGWVGGDVEDAWMFACYYDETYVTPDDETSDDTSEETSEEESDGYVNESGTEESETVAESDGVIDESDSSKPESTPATGDGTSMTVFVLLAVVALLGSAIVVKNRK